MTMMERLQDVFAAHEKRLAELNSGFHKRLESMEETLEQLTKQAIVSMPADRQQIVLLHQAMKQWDKQAYDLSLKAQELAVAFASQLQFSICDIHDIAQASLLAGYDLDLLQETFPNRPFVEIVKGYQAIMTENEPKR